MSGIKTQLAWQHPQIRLVPGFHDLVSTSFYGDVNAICWNRKLQGDFSEIVEKIKFSGNMTEIEKEELEELHLTDSGQLARSILLEDLSLLEKHGASPVLNLINHYEKDENISFFPTDVYSFHVDRSPIPTETFLCTYFGEPSEILPNSQAEQKMNVPEIRNQLKKIYDGPHEEFEKFLTEHFFDLHYQAKIGAQPISLGIGQIWKLATDHPQSQVAPCIHRAPVEKPGERRLLMIC